MDSYDRKEDVGPDAILGRQSSLDIQSQLKTIFLKIGQSQNKISSTSEAKAKFGQLGIRSSKNVDYLPTNPLQIS